jgi:hypothetical protein
MDRFLNACWVCCPRDAAGHYYPALSPLADKFQKTRFEQDPDREENQGKHTYGALAPACLSPLAGNPALEQDNGEHDEKVASVEKSRSVHTFLCATIVPGDRTGGLVKPQSRHDSAADQEKAKQNFDQ